MPMPKIVEQENSGTFSGRGMDMNTTAQIWPSTALQERCKEARPNGKLHGHLADRNPDA